MRPLLCATATATLLLLAGCGGTSGTKDDTVAPKATTSADGLTVTLSDGTSFVVPEDWKLLKDGEASKALDNKASKDAIAEIAHTMGVPTEQLMQQVNSLDAFVTATKPTNGFVDNLNATHTASSLPTAAQIEAQFGQIGGKDIHVATATTSIGDALRAQYTLPLKTVDVHGVALIVEIDHESEVITISSSSADRSDELADRVLETLATDGS